METFLSIGFALLGVGFSAYGGFLVGRWWQRHRELEWANDTQEQVGRILDRIAEKIVIEDHVAKAVDPLANGGRVALGEVLSGLRDFGGYEAVVLADDAGLVVAACGSEEAAELMAVEAAAFASATERMPGRQQTVLQTQPEKRWTLHRYFQVDGVPLSLSAARRGGTPRVEALDGALGAIQRVLDGYDDAAA